MKKYSAPARRGATRRCLSSPAWPDVAAARPSRRGCDRWPSCPPAPARQGGR